MVLVDAGAPKCLDDIPSMRGPQLSSSYHFRQAKMPAKANDKLHYATFVAFCSSWLLQACTTLHPLLLHRRNRDPAAAGGDAFIILLAPPFTHIGWRYLRHEERLMVAVVLCLALPGLFSCDKGDGVSQVQ